MAGRTIKKNHNESQEDIITTVMLEGTDGRKMSTSWGNVINIIDTPRDMFGKIMSIRDELIVKYFTLCTSISIPAIEKIKQGIEDGSIHPRDVKIQLATEIVTLYHTTEAAEEENVFFIETFSKRAIPTEVDEVHGEKDETWVDFLVRTKSISSKSEAKRLVEGGGLEIEGRRVAKAQEVIEEGVVKIGKTRFLKIVF